jgi:uncharacterized membrane protein YcaP (DUF421 family)
MEKIFFNSWESLFRTFLIGIFAYAGLILMLRISGSRALSQLNAFDFIVTVALGSTLATILLNKNIPLSDGLLAFAMLIGLQWIIGSLSVRFKSIRRLTKTEPTLLFYQGRMLSASLQKHRIHEEEILQIIRAKGLSNQHEVDAIILETNGQFSVIQKLKSENQSTTMKNVTGYTNNQSG